jgi:hypothetical protein
LLAAALNWLAAEYRPEGFLGVLQDALAPIDVVPFLMAGGLGGGNVHAPMGGFFFAGVFVEAYLIVLAVLWLLILVSRRRSSR